MARYRLVGRLETGELAELYKASRDGADVVIKLFHPKTSDLAYARDIADTARILNPLSHEGILHYLEVGTVHRRLAVAREWVNGYSLGQALQRLATKEVVLPPTVAMHIIIQILESVQKGHEAGCIHGAITPGNVIIGTGGQAAIADFGALKALQASPALKGFLNKGRGTYRAPEVARGEEVTVESDIYSLGAIAYELLTLRELNPGKGMSVRREPIAPPSRVDRRINSRIDPIIMRAVDLVAGRRFRSCHEMVTAMRNYLSATGGMPSREDVQKFVQDLFPNEVRLELSRDVPFSEEFELAEVTGAAFDGPEPERSEVVPPRAAFSSGEHGMDEVVLPKVEVERPAQNDARTIEGAPAFDVPPAEDWVAPSAKQGRPSGPRLRPGGLPLSASGPSQNTSALKGRVRVVEDFEAARAPKDTVAPPPVDEDEHRATVKSPPVAAPLRHDTPEEPRPPTTDAAQTQPQKFSTVEVRVAQREEQKRKLIIAAIAIGLVAVASFGLAVWKFKEPRALPRHEPPPNLRIVEATTVRETPTHREEPTRPEPTEPARPDTPRPGDLAFLTVESNRPAWVYIDGVKLKGRTPLAKTAVQPGTRTITLESIGSGEKKQFSLTFSRGQLRKVIENFEATPVRRAR